MYRRLGKYRKGVRTMVNTRRIDLQANAALVVIDVQKGFDEPFWGPRNNPACDTNIAALADAWIRSGRPIVVVTHDSINTESPLAPDNPGNALKAVVANLAADLLVTKRVNSAFLGEPDLAAWLRTHGVGQMAIVGIQTNMCCETTARHGSNLGFDVLFVADATYTFDKQGPDGVIVSADELARVTVVNLHGEFATIASTAQLVAQAST